MTGIYQSIFCFNSYLSAYLPVNISYLVCESTLFKITFEISMTFLHWKNYKKRFILSKTTFQIHLCCKESSWKELLLTNKNMVYVFPTLSTDEAFKKMLYSVITLVAGFLLSFLNLLFLKYMLQILAILLASSKAKNVNNVIKLGFRFALVCNQTKY